MGEEVCVLSDRVDSWKLFLSWQSCVEYVLLACNKIQDLKIEVALDISESDDVEITTNVHGLEITTATSENIVQKLSLCSNFNRPKSDMTEKKSFHFVYSCSILPTDVKTLIQYVNGYLKCILYLFNFKLTVTDMEYSGPMETDRMFVELQYEGGKEYRKINAAVFSNFLNPYSPSVCTLTLKNLPPPVSIYRDVKMTMSLFSIPRSEKCYFYDYEAPLFCTYCFGPYGLPICKSNLRSTPTLRKLLNENDLGFSVQNVIFTLPPDDFGLCRPYCLQQYIPGRRLKDYHLVLLLNIKMDEPPQELEKKAELCQLFQNEVENILASNCEDLQVVYKSVVQQTVFNSKNEMSISRIVSSIADIVACSTNDVFRDTCLGLMNSATTHDFQVDLQEALQKFTETKQVKKRKRKFSEDWEWKLLQETSSSQN